MAWIHIWLLVSSYCCPASGSCAATASIEPSCDTAAIPVQITVTEVSVRIAAPLSTAICTRCGPGSDWPRSVIRSEQPSGNHEGYDGIPTDDGSGTSRRSDPSAARTQSADVPAPRWLTPSNAICSRGPDRERSQFDRVAATSGRTTNRAGLPRRMRKVQSVQYPDVDAP